MSGSKGNKSRIAYLDLLRVLATLAVVLTHVASVDWDHVSLPSYEWSVFNLARSSVRFHVPIFVMISGATFLDPNREVTVRKLLAHNIPRIIGAYFIWSPIYLVYRIMRTGQLPEGGIHGFIEALFRAEYHMWYLPMLVGLYLITPFIRSITADRTATRWFLAVSFIFSFVLPTFEQVATSIFPIINIKYLNYLYNLERIIMRKMYFSATLNYVSYYVLGYYLASTSIKKSIARLLMALGAISVFATYKLTEIVTLSTDEAYEGFYGYFMLTSLFQAVAVFVLVKTWFKQDAPIEDNETRVKRYQSEGNRLLAGVSGRCFGVYLSHALVIKVLVDYLNLNTLSFNPVFSVPIITLIVFALSFPISFVLGKIPVLKRYAS